MDIQRGIQIDKPSIFVPWDVDVEQLSVLFKLNPLKRVTDKYYTIACELFDGLSCYLGFHFKPGTNESLRELEFFRDRYDDLQWSFEDFQSHLEKVFGLPDERYPIEEGFSGGHWLFNDTLIVHRVFDRFGPEEHVRIIKLENTETLA
ncbi:hypothetical protein C8P68_1092 [Mucilaginibacter yixingensis]|uniref:Uncharacterized protein n=1 Tax=Mucilaginibacter yixingensis TaxID=1295612 RepID=A0A2T5J577_9SPHI|nr:hypothetical protein [Mucilaginibacter yixingensis]PTQ93130.1 hypothetical protein C8P68_1092 [Mucilaginibacter yixingensis]